MTESVEFPRLRAAVPASDRIANDNLTVAAGQ